MQTIEQILAELNNAVMLQLRQALVANNTQLMRYTNTPDVIELKKQGDENEQHNNSNSSEYAEYTETQSSEIRTNYEPDSSSTQGDQDTKDEAERTNIEYAGGSTGTSIEDGEIRILAIEGKQSAVGTTYFNRNSNCASKACLVSEDYTATMDDYFIGVNSDSSVTITLPSDCSDCYELIIKSQMSPPLNYRKITITSSDGALIDGKSNYVIEHLNQSVRLMCSKLDWCVIG